MKKLTLITITSVCLLASLLTIKSILTSETIQKVELSNIKESIQMNRLSNKELEQLSRFKNEGVGVLVMIKDRTLNGALELRKYLKQVCNSGAENFQEIGFACKTGQSLMDFGISLLK